jgi:diadenosine tetraphosphate (Ap4A) HIT family hydrolase
MSIRSGCALCDGDGGIAVHRGELLRVIRVEDADFPAFYRVVWNAHVPELTDLGRDERALLLDAVAIVEGVLRERLAPTKINLASLGNMVPHLHWHVIARFDWDSHFPEPIWGRRQREVLPAAADRLPLGLPQMDTLVRRALEAADR